MTRTVTLLDRLVGFDTVSARSNLEMVDFLSTFLHDLGFRLHRITAPCGTKAGLFAVLGPSGAGGVLLSAHTDVVPTDGQVWQRPAFALSQQGNRLYGRGTTDMKGFVAAMLALAERASRIPLRRPLKLSLSYDEEIGCVGMQHMIGGLEAAIGLPDLAIIGEPTQMRVATAHKGKWAITARCLGQAGHSSLAPRFDNALHLASAFVQGLRQLQEDLARNGAQDAGFDIPYSTVHVGMMQGGSALNIVPDMAQLTMEFRHPVADDSAALWARLQALARRVSQGFGHGDIVLTVDNRYPGLAIDPAHPGVKKTLALADNGPPIKVAFGTEAGFFSQRGVPAVVCGPGNMEGQGHKPDEYIERGQLVACDQMLDRLLGDLT